MGKKLAAMQARLKVLECKRGSTATLEEIECTRMEINKLLDVEDVMWRLSGAKKFPSRQIRFKLGRRV